MGAMVRGITSRLVLQRTLRSKATKEVAAARAKEVATKVAATKAEAVAATAVEDTKALEVITITEAAGKTKAAG